MNTRIASAIIVCTLFFLEEALSQGANYPLHIGDQWQYLPSRTNDSARAQVTGDTLMSNGKTYKIYTHNWENLFTYQRIAGDTVYFYHTQTQSEYVFLNFSARTQTLISSIPGEFDTTDIYYTFSDSTDVFGLRLKRWHFRVDYIRGEADDELIFDVAENFGIVEFWGMWIDFPLQGAIINGIKYGNITGVGEPTYSLPSQFALGQNYPNPFNPTTNIVYRIEHSGYITLTIYNPIGREVTSLVQGEKQPGEYTVSWDASGLPSGAYIYRLSANTQTFSRKMMLTK